MNYAERLEAVRYCVLVTADIHGLTIEDIDPTEFNEMTDEQLQEECEWLFEISLK